MFVVGFFSLKEVCSVCGEECGLNRFQIADKQWVCPSCFKKAGLTVASPVRTMTASSVRTMIAKREENDTALTSFSITQRAGGFLHIDESSKKWYIPDGSGGKVKHPKIHSFSDIVDYELLEDGSTITKGGGLGRAVAGGLLFGGVGAIVGGVTGGHKNKPTCTSLKIKITLNDMSAPEEYITFITSETKKDGILYKTVAESAQRCLSLLQLMCDQVGASAEPGASAPQTTADEIMKFKQLLDAGAITQEEYDAKKAQLLGL